MLIIHDDYVTDRGITVPKRVIQTIIERIRKEDDYQRILQEELRDLIPERDSDHDEAQDIYRYCESILEDFEWQLEVEDEVYSEREGTYFGDFDGDECYSDADSGL